MAEPDLAGASLPEGIEVDETAAYFGITDSSDIVHQLMSMDRNQSITAFFGMVSDPSQQYIEKEEIVKDWELNRLQCTAKV